MKVRGSFKKNKKLISKILIIFNRIFKIKLYHRINKINFSIKSKIKRMLYLILKKTKNNAQVPLNKTTNIQFSHLQRKG